MKDELRKWAWNPDEEENIEKFAKEYISFLNSCKTEREVVKWIVQHAESLGYKDISTHEKLSPGDRVYKVFNNKLVLLAIVGEKDPVEGVRAVFAHGDAPRLDLKPVPLEEKDELVLLSTHYYGGIVKYQWVSIPLALHGVVITRDGKKVEFVIGESEEDPVFAIPDLLPHLGREKLEKRTASKAIEGEELRILFANRPSKEKEEKEKKNEKQSVLATVKKILKERYGIEPKDLVSADIEVVPAFKAKEIGLDRSMIGGYGQDDRICVFTAVKALFDVRETPPVTAIVGIFDREEIGSVGNAAAQSRLFEQFLREIISKTRGEYNEFLLGKLLENSKAISADVDAVFNPIFPNVHDPNNAARMGKGIILTKYTGRGGKYVASEAHAEYVGWIISIMEKAGVAWQPGVLGKVDVGGGGTVALYFANRGMNVIDMGPGVMAMHSPFEITSKADLYSAWKAYRAFFKASE